MKKKMTPTPWKANPQVSKDQAMCPVDFIEIVSMELPWWVAHVRANNTEGRADAEAIVTAVNSTYGKGIDPSSVPELLEALKSILNEEMPDTWDESRKLHHFKALAKAAIEKSIIQQ